MKRIALVGVLLAAIICAVIGVSTPSSALAGGGWGPMYSLDLATTHPIDSSMNGLSVKMTADSEIVMSAGDSYSLGSLYIWNYDESGLGEPMVLPAGPRPEALAVGTLGSDSVSVIVTANYGNNTLGLYKKVEGSWQPAVFTNTNSGPDGLAICDLLPGNGNELAVSYWTTGKINLYPYVNGVLGTPTQLTSVSAGWDDLACIDVWADGSADLLKLNGQGLNPDLELHRQITPGGYDRKDIDVSSYGYANDADAVGVGRANGDTADDILVASGNKVAVWLQDASGNFFVQWLLPIRDGFNARQVVFADASPIWADGGRNDIYSLHSDGFSIHMQSDGKYNTEPGSFFASDSYQIPGLATSTLRGGILVVDTTGDGEPEVYIAGNDGLIQLIHLPGYVPQVPTANPSATLMPTSTNLPTLVPTVTATPTKTSTPKPTMTPTKVPTKTPVPTATCVPKGKTNRCR